MRYFAVTAALRRAAWPRARRLTTVLSGTEGALELKIVFLLLNGRVPNVQEKKTIFCHTAHPAANLNTTSQGELNDTADISAFRSP